MVRRNCAHHSHGISPGAVASHAFVYMQLCRRVLFFKKLNLARNLLDDDDIVFSLVKRYIITLCLRSVHNKKTRF